MTDKRWQQGPWSPADFEQLAQQYWGAWAETMRSAVPGSGAMHRGAAPGQAAGMQGWQDAIDWWSRQARGNSTGADDAVGRFNSQARTWFAQMQDIAAQFSGRDHAARDVASAWRESLRSGGEDMFAQMLGSMRGEGLKGIDQWMESAAPYLDATLREGKAWLGLPAFGVTREHQERLQQLAQAHIEYQQADSVYNALMRKASRSAFDVFESMLVEHEEPGRQIDSPRALFDLWIDAAEEAYAEIALSTEFRKAYADLANAQMRLRAGIQEQIEQASRQFDLPTRSELDGAHRKIVELERAVRRLRDLVEAGQADRPAAKVAKKTTAAKRAAPAKKTAKKVTKKAAKKMAAKKARPARKATTKRTEG